MRPAAHHHRRIADLHRSLAAEHDALASEVDRADEREQSTRDLPLWRTAAQFAADTGYSVDRIQRLARAGCIEGVEQNGRGGKLRFARDARVCLPSGRKGAPRGKARAS